MNEDLMDSVLIKAFIESEVDVCDFDIIGYHRYTYDSGMCEALNQDWKLGSIANCDHVDSFIEMVKSFVEKRCQKHCNIDYSATDTHLFFSFVWI